MTPTPHGQVPEALIDLIDAYAETRHRYGRIHNARTEAARKAVIEALSGVQALSAAPAGPWSLGEMTGNWRDIDLPDHGGIMRIVWKMEDDEGRNEELEAQAHAVVAALNAAFSKPPAEQQAQPGAVYAELPAPTASIGTDDAWHEAAMRDFADRTHAARLRCKSEQARLATLWGYVRADAAPKAAPAPGVQWQCGPQAHGFTAPQPAPAPLSDDAKDAARYRLLRRGRHWSVIDGIGNDLLRAEALDAAIDAALAAQGGKV